MALIDRRFIVRLQYTWRSFVTGSASCIGLTLRGYRPLHMAVRRFWTALTVAGLLAASAGCGGRSSPNPTALRPAAAGDAAFRPPPGEDLKKLANGTPIWGRAIHGPPNATTYWLLYKSESAAGKAVSVSGVISIPKRAATGTRPVAAWGNGTTGLGDQCAVSKAIAGDTPPAAEFTAVAGHLLDQGYVVTATDYEGLGTDGVHPYLVAESEAHS